MIQDGRAGSLRKQAGTCNVVEMRVGYDDLPQPKLVLCKETYDLHQISAWIHHSRIVQIRVVQDRAITLQGTDWKCLTLHASSNKKGAGDPAPFSKITQPTSLVWCAASLYLIVQIGRCCET